MRAVAIAAIVSGLIAAPASAGADETTELFTLTIVAADVPHDDGSFADALSAFSTAFPLFNPSSGALDKVTVTLNGIIVAVSNVADPTLNFRLLDPAGLVFFEAMNVPIPSPPRIQINYSGTDSNVFGGLNPFVGEGTGKIDFQFATENPDKADAIASHSLLGSVTYDYTPAALTPPVPETSTWGMLLMGFAGLAFAGRRVRAGFLAGLAATGTR